MLATRAGRNILAEFVHAFNANESDSIVLCVCVCVAEEVRQILVRQRLFSNCAQYWAWKAPSFHSFRTRKRIESEQHVVHHQRWRQQQRQHIQAKQTHARKVLLTQYGTNGVRIFREHVFPYDGITHSLFVRSLLADWLAGWMNLFTSRKKGGFNEFRNSPCAVVHVYAFPNIFLAEALQSVRFGRQHMLFGWNVPSPTKGKQTCARIHCHRKTRGKSLNHRKTNAKRSKYIFIY